MGFGVVAFRCEMVSDKDKGWRCLYSSQRYAKHTGNRIKGMLYSVTFFYINKQMEYPFHVGFERKDTICFCRVFLSIRV